MNLVKLTVINANIANQEPFYLNIQHMTNLKYITCLGLSNNNITHGYIKSILPDVKQICINQKYRVY